MGCLPPPAVLEQGSCPSRERGRAGDGGCKHAGGAGLPTAALRGAVMRRGPQDGSASHHTPQHMQCTAGTAPMAELSSAPGQPQGASLKSLDPSTIAAVGRIEGPPFQLPQTQVLPHSAYQAPSPQAGLGKAILESQLPGWGAASAAGSWRRKQDPGANGRQSLALDETLDPGSRLAGGGETAAALPAHALCRARHRGARGGGGGGAKQAPESRAWGWSPPSYAPRGVGAPGR